MESYHISGSFHVWHGRLIGILRALAVPVGSSAPLRSYSISREQSRGEPRGGSIEGGSTGTVTILGKPY